jgi:ATP-binding cassette subfamily B protein
LDETPVTPPAEAEDLDFRGAVLIRGRGRQPAAAVDAAREELSEDLKAALDEPPVRPGQEFLRILREDGLLAPISLALIFGLVATGVMTEMLLFRGLLDLGAQLATAPQRLGMMAALILFVVASRGLHYLSQVDVLGVGRRLEVRLRKAFLEKLPRLGDRYFRSRPVSDMAERAHSLHKLRDVSELGARFFQYFFETLLTAVGMIWIHPARADAVIVGTILALVIPLMARPTLGELDLRMRSHLGALMKFYLDALLGLVAVRVHAAERTLRREQESLLKEWAGSHLHFNRLFIVTEGIQIVVVMTAVVWTVLDYVASSPETGGLLLLAYWGVNLPFRGRMIIYAAIDYVRQRNVLLRMLEPLTAPEAERPEVAPEILAAGRSETPVAITFEGVGVRAGGHTILEGIDVHVEAGEHVAVVGSSGAGKTTLVSLLLGWHHPAGGRVLVDGEELDDLRLELLRRETAWLDPAVQIWNRSLLENLRYGNASDAVTWNRVIEEAELRGVLEKLPEGFQTSLGEGGGLVSGGEGQRVRLGRAMARPGVRLAILDEPFRGLGRGQRHSLLERSRQRWCGVTLLCVTHDVAETRAFPRVLVVEGGRVVEDASPAELESRPDSRYSELLAAEERVHALWRTDVWRQFWLENGRAVER